MSAIELTTEQERVLIAIFNHWNKNGAWPTYESLIFEMLNEGIDFDKTIEEKYGYSIGEIVYVNYSEHTNADNRFAQVFRPSTVEGKIIVHLLDTKTFEPQKSKILLLINGLRKLHSNEIKMFEDAGINPYPNKICQ